MGQERVVNSFQGLGFAVGYTDKGIYVNLSKSERDVLTIQTSGEE